MNGEKVSSPSSSATRPATPWRGCSPLRDGSPTPQARSWRTQLTQTAVASTSGMPSGGLLGAEDAENDQPRRRNPGPGVGLAQQQGREEQAEERL